MTEELLAPPHIAKREVLVTAGANAANYIVAQTFINPGDYVFIPEVTYPLVHMIVSPGIMLLTIFSIVLGPISDTK